MSVKMDSKKEPSHPIAIKIKINVIFDFETQTFFARDKNKIDFKAVSNLMLRLHKFDFLK